MANNDDYNNPHNLMQMVAIRDLLAIGIDPKCTLAEAMMILEHGDKSVVEQLQFLESQHKYPDKKIKYTQLSVYELCPALHSVSDRAQALFLLLARLQDKDTGYVGIKKATFCEILGFGDKHKRYMQKYIDELADIGVIRIVSQPRQGSKSPVIIQISNQISRTGKGFTPQLIGDTTRIYTRGYEQAKLFSCGSKMIRYGTLVPVVEAAATKKKEPIAPDNANGPQNDNDINNTIDYNTDNMITQHDGDQNIPFVTD